MKKTIAILLSLMLLVGVLSGCGGSSDTASDAAAPAADTEPAETAEAAETSDTAETEEPADTAGASEDQSDVPNEIYTGVAAGYHGDIKVEVEIDKDGKIVRVDVLENNETENVGTIAIEKIPGLIASENTLDVDAVTGATVTTQGIKDAVANALTNAGLDPMSYGYVEPPKEIELSSFDASTLPEKEPVTGSVTVTDVKGREVTIDLPVSRYAISTMDVIDFIIPLMGEEAFAKLSGSGQDGGGGLQGYARLYVPVVGDYLIHCAQISEHNAPFDLEMILAADPDVLIVNSAMGAHKYAMEIEETLTAAGIPIVMAYNLLHNKPVSG